MSKRRGRPTVDPRQASTQVNVAIPNAVYDRLYTSSRAQRVKVNDVFRAALNRYLRAKATSTRGD